MRSLIFALLISLTIVSTTRAQAARPLLKTWHHSFATVAIQERHDKMRYQGRWIRADHDDYIGDHARSTERKGDTVSLTVYHAQSHLFGSDGQVI